MSGPRWLSGFLTWAKARGRARQTLEWYSPFARLYGRFLEEQGIDDPADATRAHVADFQAHIATLKSRLGKPYASSSRVHILTTVKTLYAYLIECGRVLVDPTAAMKIPHVGRHLPRAILSHDEMRRLLAVPDTTTLRGLRNRAILEVFYSTGIRYSELADLKAFDVDLVEQTIWIRRGKGGKDRVLPLGRWATHWLARYIEASESQRRKRGTDRVFLAEHTERIPNKILNNTLRDCAKKAGITKPVTLHAIRHTFATQLLRGGADVRTIQQFLGHAELSATEIYTHLDLGDLRRTQIACHPREKKPTGKPPRSWRDRRKKR